MIEQKWTLDHMITVVLKDLKAQQQLLLSVSWFIPQILFIFVLKTQ